MVDQQNDVQISIIKRGQLKAKLTRFQTFLNDSASENKVQLKLRTEKIREIWNEFDVVQNNIEAKDDSEENLRYRDTFINSYFDALTIAEERLGNMCDINSQQVRSTYTLDNNIQSAPVRLKPLEVPIFTGKFDEWATFQDMFLSLIHNNKTISKIEKFFYLRNALSGEANTLIQNLETSTSNYDAAWTMITNRYNNKRQLIQCHTKYIYDLEPIMRESASKLRKFTNSLNTHIHALQALNQDPYQWGALLFHIISTKIDLHTMRQLEAEIPKGELPSIQFVLDFLEKRCQILESIESTKGLTGRNEAIGITNKNIRGSTYNQKKVSAFISTSKMKCYQCQQPHPIYRCPEFLALDVQARIDKVYELKLCKNCLKNDHHAKQCIGRKCTKCQKNHNTLLHKITIDNNSDDSSSPNIPLVTAHTAEGMASSQILLATAIVKISNVTCGNRYVHGRALLDSGSQSNFITDKLVNKLGLKKLNVNMPICGINGSRNIVRYKVIATVQSLTSAYATTIELLVLPAITGSLPHSRVSNNLEIPNNIKIADPSFYNPGNIEILIGGDTYWDVMCSDKIKIQVDGPYLQNTLLGWVIVGKTSQNNSNNICLFASNSDDKTLSDKIETFWKLEEVTTNYKITEEEKLCKLHFEDNVTRNEHGRYVVRLPFKNDHRRLGGSFSSAMRRFISLEHRLSKNIDLYNKYKMFMKEYEYLEHMKYVSDTGSNKNQLDCDNYYYLPHSCVINEHSKTTKLRVVFDASAKTSSGVSLNDILMNGAKVQPDLLDIVIHFRTRKFAFSADIVKMYRQVILHQDDRKYQRILWRSNPQEEIKIYELCTVTYGVAPAGFLAASCVNRVADGLISETLRDVIKNDFCVDDCLTGADTLSDAIKLRDELIVVMKQAGFELSKWTANHKELIPTSVSNDITALSMDKEKVKTLGLYWKPDGDHFTYVVQTTKINKQITKRNVLAGIATLFDPLGLVGPVILVAKILMQELWRDKYGWDDILPSHIQTKWLKYSECLNELNLFKIPRWLECNEESINEIHGFADASLKAYGACIYVRTTRADGKINSRLICAKSRVAPLKCVSIPRLELCAAVLLSRLASTIIPALRIRVNRRYFWSDSTVTLAWIQSESNTWKTFIANRVGEIHILTSREEWGHISTSTNPADVLSRGCEPIELKNNNLWWYGPQWLCEEQLWWPMSNTVLDGEENNHVEIERKSVTVSLVETVENRLSIIDKYSSLGKLYRIIAYVFRFKNNCLALVRKTDKIHGLLQLEEIKTATKSIIKLIQGVYFQTELRDIKNARAVSSKSKIYNFGAFIDDNGILRVGGRLSNATDINYDTQYPILIPKNCHFAVILIRHEHIKLLHAGPQAVLAAVRLRYWPIGGRQMVKKIVRQCITCFKTQPRSASPSMGNLPRDRISKPLRCFENCGIDYAGPFLLKCSTRRNAAAMKSYICLFVCFASKAIHLELVCDLTTDAFIAALTRFISRRGMCKNIYSDNATCFVGANNKMNEFRELINTNDHRTRVQRFVTDREITWHFIPPRAPHFGGLWEAAVRSVKKHLNRSLSTVKFTYDEFYTLLVQIEACLNSRPLVPLSSDPVDLSALTPAHFLIGGSLIALPEPDISLFSENLVSRWQRVQQMAQLMWRRWSVEYVTQLQGRTKWVKSGDSTIQVGTMVIIKDVNAPPLHWSMGRVKEIYPGKDGEVRVAMVRTIKGDVKRMVRALCPLPIN